VVVVVDVAMVNVLSGAVAVAVDEARVNMNVLSMPGLAVVVAVTVSVVDVAVPVCEAPRNAPAAT
jgi:hypothetical protein